MRATALVDRRAQVSAQTLLTSIETAIQAFLTDGAIESYTVEIPGGGTRTVTRADLASLRQMRTELTAEVAAAKNAGPNYFRRGVA